MEIRYSALRQFYQKLTLRSEIKIPFPQKFLFGNLSEEKLKKRAKGIQKFLEEIGRYIHLNIKK